MRHLLARGRRATVKRGVRPHKKTAITKPELEAMLATCDDSLEDIRDRALLYFGFASSGRRRSEIAVADCQDLRRTGTTDFVYRLEHSKTQQAGASATSTPDKPALGRAGVALAAWLTQVRVPWEPEDSFTPPSDAPGALLIALDGEASAAALLTDAVTAGVPVTSLAPVGGALEQTYLSLEEERR